MDPEGCSGWDIFNPLCYATEGAKSVLGDAIENMSNAVLEAVGKSLASLGTVWVNVGTPNLTGGGGSSVAAGESAPDAGNITTVMGYVMWISLAVAVVSLFALGAMVATRVRRGEGLMAVGRMGLVLASVVLVSAAGAIVGAVLPDGPRNASGTVGFLQSSLWWYMSAAAVVAVIIGAARMAWEHRAEPGRDLVRGLVTLIVVAGAGVTIVGLLVEAADSFSLWIINNSLECDVVADSACFGQSVATLLSLNPTAPGLTSLLIIILGLVALLAAVVQIVLMVARSGMLVILAGILPLSAAATNTEMGRAWFKKSIAWLVAFILYKPAAAIVYAAAFQLVGTDVFKDDGSGLLPVLTGLMLMIMALFAMPALMRFVAPMVGSLTGGGAGGAMALAGAAALPTGAAQLGRLSTGGGFGGGFGGPSGADGATGSAGPSGGGQPSQGMPSGGQTGGAPTGQGVAGGAGASTGAAASGGGAAASGGGAASGAAASGAAAGSGAAAAGAAGGPVGLAAGAVLDVAKSAGQAAAGAARSMSQQATGEGEPSGSR